MGLIIYSLIGLLSGWSLMTIIHPAFYTPAKISNIEAVLSWVNAVVAVLIVVLAWQSRDANTVIWAISVLIISGILQKKAYRRLNEAFIAMVATCQIGAFQASDEKDENDCQVGTLFIGNLALEAVSLEDELLPTDVMVAVGVYVELDDWQQPRQIMVYALDEDRCKEIIAAQQQEYDD